MMANPWMKQLLCLIAPWLLLLHRPVESFAASASRAFYDNNDDPFAPSTFSLENYQKACALETSQKLDASRLHFQILFVDDDNTKGRIAEGLLAKIAEYNDAMFVLFPSSATISSSRNAPRDAAASSDVLSVCNSLGLCPTRSETMGTDFDLSYLDEYDLIIAMDEDIRSLILRSIASSEDQEYYRPRCRLLSEFLSPEFVLSSMTHENCEDQALSNKKSKKDRNKVQFNMLDSIFQERVAPFAEHVLDRSSNLFTTSPYQYKSANWPLIEAGLIMASAGITRFCLSTIQAQFEVAFQSLLEKNIYKKEHLGKDWEEVDDQLRRCNAVVTGYFSPGQRKSRFERHTKKLGSVEGGISSDNN